MINRTGRGQIITIFYLFLREYFYIVQVYLFKFPVILNVTLRLIFDVNIKKCLHMHIRDACKVAHNQEGTVPIIAILVDMKNEVVKLKKIVLKQHPFAIFAFQTRQKCREDHCDKNKNNNVSNMITCVHLGYMC
jgi:hypothetical protein